MTLKISVVVISFNQRDFIKRLVGQLLNQDFPSDEYEVLVVECASTDSTADWLSAQTDSRLQPVVLDKPCNRSAGRNHGIRLAKGDIIIMIDGDHTIQPNFIAVHHRAHQNRVCAIVGKSDFGDEPDYSAINNYLNNSGAAKFPHGASLPGRYFLTRNCSVPREAMINIGLFDDSFDQWGGEDLDLGVRIEEAGIPIYGEPAALAIHHHYRSIEAVLRNMEHYGRGSIPLLLRKHPQLFRELNLDRLFNNPFEPNRFSGPNRMINRILCLRPFYIVALALAKTFRKHHQPRALLDYLHLRAYSHGYASAASPKP